MQKELKILVVDDTFTNRFLVVELLKNTGHKCFQAQNGREGIDKIIEHEPDIVLLDIEMPVMNGFETLEYIRTKLPDPLNKIPVFAITAHNPELFTGEFADYIFTDILTKPYTSERITSMLRKYVDF